MSRRSIPLILVASPSAALAERTAVQLRRDGNLVYVAHSADGCLRVATSVGPDMVLLDPSFPERLERLLRAHPISAAAEILHLSESLPQQTFALERETITAGPHAA